MSSTRFTKAEFERGLADLGRRDPDLATVLERHGPPPMWSRKPGFPTLVRIILEQQVSLASAKAAYDRLLKAVSALAPETFLELDDQQLLQIGFSRQKARYCRGLAAAIVNGDFRLAQLRRKSDERARDELLAIVGIGPWTADIYLLMALNKPDIWPVGDLALAEAMREIKGLETRPSGEEQLEIAEHWRPWRAVAARIHWHHYLSGSS